MTDSESEQHIDGETLRRLLQRRASDIALELNCRQEEVMIALSGIQFSTTTSYPYPNEPSSHQLEVISSTIGVTQQPTRLQSSFPAVSFSPGGSGPLPTSTSNLQRSVLVGPASNEDYRRAVWGTKPSNHPPVTTSRSNHSVSLQLPLGTPTTLVEKSHLNEVRKVRRPQAKSSSSSIHHLSGGAAPAASSLLSTAYDAAVTSVTASKVKVGYLCVADEFNLEQMKEYYSSQKFTCLLEYDVLHIHRVDPKAKGEEFNVFLFKYGSVVFWGSPYSFTQVIEKDFIFAPKLNSVISRNMSGRYPTEVVAKNFPVYCTYEMIDEVEDETVFQATLHQRDHFRVSSAEAMLCVSHALAQSAKIEYMEVTITELTQKCKPLPRDLKEKGGVTISERALLQLRGEVLFYRLMLKSGSDLLDEPELFWDHPSLKPFYNVTKAFFEVSDRVNALDEKLGASNEILSMIADQFSQRHSSRLEWIVIWLVLVEVIIGVLELVLDVKPWVK